MKINQAINMKSKKTQLEKYLNYSNNYYSLFLVTGIIIYFLGYAFVFTTIDFFSLDFFNIIYFLHGIIIFVFFIILLGLSYLPLRHQFQNNLSIFTYNSLKLFTISLIYIILYMLLTFRSSSYMVGSSISRFFTTSLILGVVIMIIFYYVVGNELNLSNAKKGILAFIALNSIIFAILFHFAFFAPQIPSHMGGLLNQKGIIYLNSGDLRFDIKNDLREISIRQIENTKLSELEIFKSKPVYIIYNSDNKLILRYISNSDNQLHTLEILKEKVLGLIWEQDD